MPRRAAQAGTLVGVPFVLLPSVRLGTARVAAIPSNWSWFPTPEIAATERYLRFGTVRVFPGVQGGVTTKMCHDSIFRPVF